MAVVQGIDSGNSNAGTVKDNSGDTVKRGPEIFWVEELVLLKRGKEGALEKHIERLGVDKDKSKLDDPRQNIPAIAEFAAGPDVVALYKRMAMGSPVVEDGKEVVKVIPSSAAPGTIYWINGKIVGPGEIPAQRTPEIRALVNNYYAGKGDEIIMLGNDGHYRLLNKKSNVVLKMDRKPIR